MKQTLTSIATAFIMIASLSAFAAEKTNPLKDVATSEILTTYLEATTLGSTDLNKFLFAEDFSYENAANGDRFNKKEYTDFLKAHENITFDCETNYEMLDESGQAGVAKVTMKYKKFTRVDYVTLTQSEDGWKVSKVVTTYPKF